MPIPVRAELKLALEKAAEIKIVEHDIQHLEVAAEEDPNGED